MSELERGWYVWEPPRRMSRKSQPWREAKTRPAPEPFTEYIYLVGERKLRVGAVMLQFFRPVQKRLGMNLTRTFTMTKPTALDRFHEGILRKVDPLHKLALEDAWVEGALQEVARWEKRTS